jgi:hypothetical protein
VDDERANHFGTALMETRATERDVASARADFLIAEGRYAGADFPTLRFMLPGKYLKLSAADREMQRHRLNEQKWHAVLRNIGAHAGQPGNAITEGLLVKRKGGGYALGPNAKNPRSTGENE